MIAFVDAPIPMNVSVASKILAAPSIARNIWDVDVSRIRKTKNVASLDVVCKFLSFLWYTNHKLSFRLACIGLTDSFGFSHTYIRIPLLAKIQS